jgi:hypothetical protein
MKHPKQQMSMPQLIKMYIYNIHIFLIYIHISISYIYIYICLYKSELLTQIFVIRNAFRVLHIKYHFNLHYLKSNEY